MCPRKLQKIDSFNLSKDVIQAAKSWQVEGLLSQCIKELSSGLNAKCQKLAFKNTRPHCNLSALENPAGMALVRAFPAWPGPAPPPPRLLLAWSPRNRTPRNFLFLAGNLQVGAHRGDVRVPVGWKSAWVWEGRHSRLPWPLTGRRGTQDSWVLWPRDPPGGVHALPAPSIPPVPGKEAGHVQGKDRFCDTPRQCAWPSGAPGGSPLLRGSRGRSHHVAAGEAEAAEPTRSPPRAQKRFAGPTEAAPAPATRGAPWPLFRRSQVNVSTWKDTAL